MQGYTRDAMSRICLTMLLLGLIISTQAATEQPTFVVRGPTILAFFSHVDQKQLDRDFDLATILDDFRFYAGKVRPELSKRGIELKEVYAPSFRVVTAGKTATFRPSRTKNIGYYFIAPGKAPLIKYGVSTDADLLHFATEYFGLSSK